MLLCSCTQNENGSHAAGRDTAASSRGVSLEEWRQSRPYPAGGPHRIELGVVPEGGVLRLGLRGKKSGTGAQGGVHAAVLAGEEKAGTIEVPADGIWVDRRIDLGGRRFAGKPCVLEIGADCETEVAPCEIVQPNNDKPNVLLLLIDALRYDHLSCYYYPQKTSPNIDALAAESTQFWNLVPQSSWTRPSVASLLTATYPNTHGVYDKLDCLRPNLPSLAHALIQGGYEAHGFMTNSCCLPVWGIGLDFNRYVDVSMGKGGDDKQAIDKVIETLGNTAGRPWFYYVHLISPHHPYEPPKPYREKFMPASFPGTRPQVRAQRDMALYDGEIAYVDGQAGRLFESMKRAGLYENTLIILLADHGEQFMEHGNSGHGNSLFEEELRIPLLIKLPGQHAASEAKQFVEMVDVAPTILDLLGLPAEKGFEGASFRALLEKKGSYSKEQVYSCLRMDGNSLRMAKNREVKYILNVVTGESSWYDVRNDLQEMWPRQTPLAGGEDLASYAGRKALEGASGLHLLITGGRETEGQMTGTISSPGLRGYDLDFASMAGEVSRTNNGLSFTISLYHADDKQERDLMTQGRAVQNSAHFRFDVDKGAAVSISLLWNGKPLPEKTGWAGAAMTPAPLTGESLPVRTLQAPMDAFDPAGLPVRVSAYTWYVEPTKGLEEEDLSPEMRGSLEALGYLK